MMIPQISFPKKNQETKNSSTLLGACLQRHPRTTPTKMIPVFTVFTWKNCFGKDSGYAPPTCWKHILSDHHLDTQKIHSCAGAAIDGRQIVGICGEIFGDFAWTSKIQVGRHQWWQSKWHDLGKIEIGGWCYVNTCMIYLVEIKKCANAKIPGHFWRHFPEIPTTIEWLSAIMVIIRAAQKLWVLLEMGGFNISNIGCPRDKNNKIVFSRQAPTSYKWNFNRRKHDNAARFKKLFLIQHQFALVPHGCP